MHFTESVKEKVMMKERELCVLYSFPESERKRDRDKNMKEREGST